MKKEDYKNRQGVCPKCGSYNLDYKAIRFEGQMCYYPYECMDCKQEGEEWYSMEFSGHNIYTEDGELIEL